ncbi:WAPL family protein [Aspergillus lucknowensis]|uniref:Wings apart-like protein regulation of heterochromatin-domain-containing protein n=1 Tax=Aspergillus lucknowensis TaxID=176173 RepID=A0ABR4LPJ8_9EURO
MPPNKKRPVTYGKSPLNRLESYEPDSGGSGSSKLSPPSLNDGPATPTSCPPSPSTQTNLTLLPLGNLSSFSPSKADDACDVMQRKRRKSHHKERGWDYIHGPMKAGAGLGGRSRHLNLRDGRHLLPEIPSQGSDWDAANITRSSRSNTTGEVTLVNCPSPSSWRSTRQQKPTFQRQLSDDRSMGCPSNRSPRVGSASPRKRLVDSLGAVEQYSEDLTSEPDGGPFDRPDLSSAPQPTARHLSKSRARDVELLQRTPTNSTSSMLRSSRVTYSRQRSFLNDSTEMADYPPHTVGAQPKSNLERDPHYLLSSRISSEDDESVDGKPVRSLHELRQAGDNARFREIVDSIFEDIEDEYNSVSGRCSSLADLCGKLLDSRFAHRFSEQGFDERLVKCTSNASNTIDASLALGAYKLILTTGQASRTFCESLWARILDTSLPLLNTEDDLLVLAREPSLHLSKTAQTSIRGIRSHLLSAIESPSPCLSPRLLALECTNSTLKVLRERSLTVCSAPTSFLNKLIDLLAANPPHAPGPTGDPRMLGLIYSILEDYSIISGPLDSNQFQCFQRLARLYGHFTLNLSNQIRPILMSYIRVVLNLTNKEPALCDSFALPELVSGLVGIVIREFSYVSKDYGPNENNALNAVILALGTLTNLAETTEQSRAIFVRSDDRTISLLQQLLGQFSDSVSSMDQAHSVPEAHENVVAGYLSILLLTICLDKEARIFVKKSLNGYGLATVLSTAEKFLQYHREVEKDAHLFETSEEVGSRLTGRLGLIVTRVRNLESVADQQLCA